MNASILKTIIFQCTSYTIYQKLQRLFPYKGILNYAIGIRNIFSILISIYRPFRDIW